MLPSLLGYSDHRDISQDGHCAGEQPECFQTYRNIRHEQINGGQMMMAAMTRTLRVMKPAGGERKLWLEHGISGEGLIPTMLLPRRWLFHQY